MSEGPGVSQAVSYEFVDRSGSDPILSALALVPLGEDELVARAHPRPRSAVLRTARRRKCGDVGAPPERRVFLADLLGKSIVVYVVTMPPQEHADATEQHPVPGVLRTPPSGLSDLERALQDLRPVLIGDAEHTATAPTVFVPEEPMDRLRATSADSVSTKRAARRSGRSCTRQEASACSTRGS